jgi:uncharacterized protein YcbX
MTSIGAIASLFRYPVKSMAGETLSAGQMTLRGLEGDRTFGLIDAATLKIASAKRPQLWRDMLLFSASTVAATDTRPSQRIRITLPNGETISTDDSDIDAMLSSALGRAVRLSSQRPHGIEIERSHPDKVLGDGVQSSATFDTMTLAAAAPEGGFFDYAPVHVMMSASLDRIAAAVSDGQIGAARYRPNILVAGVSKEAFQENAWVGRSLQFGPDVVLKIVAPTPRCAVPTLAQAGLRQEPRALRAVADLNRAEFPGFGLQPCLGAYAEVVRQGTIRSGDEVKLLADAA